MQDDALIAVTGKGLNDSQTASQKQGSTAQDRNGLNTSLRRINPLSQFSSYTYSISLYMLTPEALNYFITSGQLPPTVNDGYYTIVAQSAGINNEKEPRALTSDKQGVGGPGKPGLDLYIDELAIETTMAGRDGSKTATCHNNFTFKVVEPTGFTFLTKLANASQWLNQQSNLYKANQLDKPNLYQQIYAIGVRFYGYDVNGNAVVSSDVENSDKIAGDPYAIFQRIFTVNADSVTFSINGRATVYNWQCTNLGERAAFGSKNGVFNSGGSLEGSTVGEVLGTADNNNTKSLIGWLNANQIDKTNNENQKTSHKYNIRWVKSDNGWFDGEEIAKSSVVTGVFSNENAPMSEAKSTAEANVTTADKSDTINKGAKIIAFNMGEAVVNVIDKIISRSSYITDALTKRVTPNAEAGNQDTPVTKTLDWYTIKPVVKIIDRDPTRRDWTYEITYEIAPYKIATVPNVYVGTTNLYYGPVKEYAYTLTGLNTEVLSYEMTYNNAFYSVTAITKNKDDSANKSNNVPPTTPVNSEGGNQGDASGGDKNKGSTIADGVRANLYSVADQATATIKILGDPDYLMDSIGSETVGNTASVFYGKNYTINPYGGQIFVEVSFGVAEDYGANGLLDVTTGSINFYPQNIQQVAKPKGTVYQIITVKSNFSKGRFEQDLELFIIPGNRLVLDNTKTVEQRESTPATAAGPGDVRTPQAAVISAPAAGSGGEQAPPPVKPPSVAVQSSNDDQAAGYYYGDNPAA